MFEFLYLRPERFGGERTVFGRGIVAGDKLLGVFLRRCGKLLLRLVMFVLQLIYLLQSLAQSGITRRTDCGRLRAVIQHAQE